METPGNMQSCTDLVKIEQNKNEFNKMRDALQSIAYEMQRFQESTLESESSSALSPDCNENQKVLAELVKCKTKIKSKKNHIRKLRKNLKTACFVAKIVGSTKRTEPGSVMGNVDIAQEHVDLLQKRYKNSIQTINDLSKENKILHSKLDNVANFIRLGYDELQKIRNEAANEPSILVQLRHLIDCCGEYYADYCNEHEECLRLEQKNCFLTNKIQDLENNVDELSEQLKTLKYRNFRLLKENNHIKNRCGKPKLCNDDALVAYSEVKMYSRDRKSISDIANGNATHKRESSDYKILYTERGFDLSPHLSLVNKLLRQQDVLLKDLKGLSQEFCKDYDNL